MFLLDVSLQPLKRVRRFVVDLTAFPETEEQVLTATFSQVAIVYVERELLSTRKRCALGFNT